MTKTRLLAIGFVLVTACQNGTAPTTTTAEVPVVSTTTTSTTVSTTTTTTDPETSTTTAGIDTFTWFDVDGIDFPANAATVDDLPDVMTRYLNAPMPEPDLSIEGPSDAERWVAEWLDWMAWAGANPGAAAEAVDVGWLPTAPQGQQTAQGLEQDAAGGLRTLGIPFYPVSITGTFDQAFEDGQLLNLFIQVEDRVPTYTIDENGNVTDVSELSQETPTLRLVLRLDEENQWRAEQIAVDS